MLRGLYRKAWSRVHAQASQPRARVEGMQLAFQPKGEG